MYHIGNGRVLFSNKSPCLLLPLYHIVNDSVAKCNLMHHTKIQKQLFQNEGNRPQTFFFVDSIHLSGGAGLPFCSIDLRYIQFSSYIFERYYLFTGIFVRKNNIY